MEKTPFVRDYRKLFKNGLLKKEQVERYIRRYQNFDDLRPRPAAFYYILEPSEGRYHFIGGQQERISGISNEILLKEGVQCFLTRVHPEDLSLLVSLVYADLLRWLRQRDSSLALEDIFFQYNYRFCNTLGNYVNLMEYVSVLEITTHGKASLILGWVLQVGEKEMMPMKASLCVQRQEMIEVLKEKRYYRIGDRFRLTSRELDILRNLAAGRSSKEIAAVCFISPHTVATHRRNLLRKMGCHSVTEMIRIAHEEGLL